MRQIKLQFEEPNITKSLKYSDLTIDQKINIKANSCGFQSIWIKSMLPWNINYAQTINSWHTEFRFLTKRWEWHHKTNNKHRLNIKGRLDLL